MNLGAQSDIMFDNSDTWIHSYTTFEDLLITTYKRVGQQDIVCLVVVCVCKVPETKDIILVHSIPTSYKQCSQCMTAYVKWCAIELFHERQSLLNKSDTQVTNK